MHRPMHSKLWHWVPRLAWWYRWCLCLRFASNDASGYRETDQSIAQYGKYSKKAPDTDGYEKTGSLLGKLGGFQSSVAPEAQITLDELKEIDPSSAKDAKKSRFHAYFHAPE